MGTQRWNVSTTRSTGEVMYVRGFRRLLEGPPRYSELYSTLLSAYSTCLDELASLVGEGVKLIGYDQIEIEGEHGFSIVSNLPDEQLLALKEEASEAVLSRVRSVGFSGRN